MTRNHFQIMAVAGTLLVQSCATTQTASVELAPMDVTESLSEDRDTAQGELSSSEPIEAPDALTEDLLSLTTTTASDVRLDIEATDRPAAQFFAELARSQSINLLVDPSVSGSITLSLRNVTLSQIFAALQDLYGYNFERTGYGYRVTPNQLATRVYRLNYLNVQRQGQSTTEIGGDGNNNITTAFSNSSADGSDNFWRSIDTSITGLIRSSDQNTDPVIVNEQTGLVVVTASTVEHSAIQQFLADAELIMQQQVIIEAKIVEVTLDDEYSSGVNWQFFNEAFGNDNTAFDLGIAGDTLSGIGGSGGVFNLSLSLYNFGAFLELLDYQGDVQVLSSPRVSTLNNQKAVIKIGSDEYFATTETISTSDDEDDATNEVVASIALEQFFSGIALDVTPQIDDRENVTLHVRPSVTEVTEQTKIISLNGVDYTLPLAYSNIRESDSIIRAQSGQIVVIGGLLQQSQDLSSAGVPGLSRVPGLNLFFSQERQQARKSELVILLKPTVYDEYTGVDDIDQVIERLQ